jgi:CDP-diacylglycerol--glycerol-3-phosphate 3-phosphatidyltransferase
VNLPNAITVFRIVLAPVATYLILQPDASSRLLAMLVFLVAALSDLVDGALARRRGEITNFGKLVDPIADKLLLVATVVPFYLIARENPDLGRMPIFGALGLWVLVVFFGREIVVTWLRTRAARRGTVVPAMQSGKYKAFSQNVFIGSMILWLAYRTDALTNGGAQRFGAWWDGFHGWFTTISLAVALGFTIYSFVVYVAAFRGLAAEPTG